jgi:HK97 gp10 family phage protein
LKITCKLEGQEKLNAKLREMTGAIGYDNMEHILLEGAEKVRDALKEAAPVGPTGNLKKSPIAKAMPKSKQPVAIAGIDRKIAPHAHFIEFGTVKMAARPFFRPTWDRLREEVGQEVVEKAKKLVEDAAR